MSTTLFVVSLVIVTALFFDFTNGFHDSANAMATSVATGALRPKTAVLIAAILNVAGAFLSTEVAKTISGGIVNDALVTPTMIFAGLVGAILWNLMTWLFGLPSSSSHALFGGLIGAVLIGAGLSGVNFSVVVSKILLPALMAPLVAGLAAGLATLILYKMIRKGRTGARRRLVPPRADGIRIDDRVGARHVRRAEDDGRDHPGADHRRVPGIGHRTGAVGDRLSRAGDRAGHLFRRLADHADDGQGLVDIRAPQGFAAETLRGRNPGSSMGFGLSTTQVCSGSILGAGWAKLAEVAGPPPGRWSTAGC